MVGKGKNMSKKKSGTKGKATGDIRSIAVNRRARHEYHVDETFEVGIVLQGTEVKSIRAGKLNFKDSFATVTDGELWLLNLHIDEYEQGNRFNHLPTRKRKLLMRKREIAKLLGKTRQDGYTLIPLEFYFKKSWVKVKIGLCKGKKLHDKRHDIAKRDAKRQIERAMKHNR
jgi:SsrA-binding protein